MFYLLMAIICSTMITLVMRIGEGKIRNNMGMFMTNYAICVLVSRISMGEMNLFTKTEGIGFSMALGLCTGIMFLACFVFMQWNMKKNGVVMTSTFTKLGVLVPTLMAILIFGEIPQLIQVLGIIIALAAILIIHFDKENDVVQNGNMKKWLIVQLLMSGFTDSLVNIYDKTGNLILKDHYLFYTFLTAFILALVMGVRKKEKFCKWDVLFGVLIGVPNYFSSSFMLLALRSVPAIIAYPVCNVGTIVTISVASMLLFKEKISNCKKIGLLFVMVALVLLNF